MDTIAFKVVTPNPEWLPQVEIYINDRRLIDMVREVELPYAMREGHPDIAGGYMGLRPDMVFFPSRHFLGGHTEDFTYTTKTEILACEACGEIICWPLLVQIDVHENTIVWRDFEQPHRKENSREGSILGHWSYDQFGPFVFDKEQYLSALAKPQ
jgi:hypothetical protein